MSRTFELSNVLEKSELRHFVPGRKSRKYVPWNGFGTKIHFELIIVNWYDEYKYSIRWVWL